MPTLADIHGLVSGVIEEGNRQQFFKALGGATGVVIFVHVIATTIVPGVLWVWANAVKQIVEHFLSVIFASWVVAIFMTPFYLVELVIGNLSNICVIAELGWFQFHEKFNDNNNANFIYVCHRYKQLHEQDRLFLFAAQVFRSGVRAKDLQDRQSVMPFALLLPFTIIKMSIHIDNELDKRGAAPQNLHHSLAKVVGAVVVLDWGFLIWDSVLGPTENFQGGLPYIFGFMIIVGTLVVLAVLGQVVPSIGGSDQTLHRHIQWMHCVAGFSLPAAAQPLVALASLAVLINYVVKFKTD